jgi:hypothetical protein
MPSRAFKVLSKKMEVNVVIIGTLEQLATSFTGCKFCNSLQVHKQTNKPSYTTETVVTVFLQCSI